MLKELILNAGLGFSAGAAFGKMGYLNGEPLARDNYVIIGVCSVLLRPSWNLGCRFTNLDDKIKEESESERIANIGVCVTSRI